MRKYAPDQDQTRPDRTKPLLFLATLILIMQHILQCNALHDIAQG
ncbi:MAG: hypothetical protein JWQ10_4161 [Herbaspirillum sp.]|nr:hypothetical protein [Herbaspirillum sp.]